MLNLDMSTYIDLLCNKLTKPTLFLQKEMKDIRTNAYVIKVAPLWEANTNTQFILDPIHYNKLLHIIFTKIDKSTTNEFKPSLKNVDENIDANLRIKKLSNVFSKCATNVCPINNLYHFIITILSCF